MRISPSGTAAQKTTLEREKETATSSRDTVSTTPRKIDPLGKSGQDGRSGSGSSGSGSSSSGGTTTGSSSSAGASTLRSGSSTTVRTLSTTASRTPGSGASGSGSSGRGQASTLSSNSASGDRSTLSIDATEPTSASASLTSTTSEGVGTETDSGAGGVTSGRVVGYDEKGNPITEDWLKSQIQPSKLEQQKVDSVEASKSMSELIGKVTGSERINKEFFAYLDGKYSGVVRAPDGMDIYQNPQNYSAEQKVARYIDLLKVKSQFEAYRDARQQENTGNSKTILNEPEVLKDIQQGMETLLEDPAVSGLLASEYLQGTREILEGKRFQDDEAQYDQAYTDAVEKLRTDINAQFKADILDGGIFNGGAARGANELSILTNYNSALKAFGSVLGAAEIEQHQDVINNSYNEFYTSKIEPLLPDSSSSYTSMLLASIQNLNVPEALKLNMGMMTPIIDGKTHVDLGLDLKTSGLADKLAGIKMNPETLAELRALGVSANLAQDGFTATFLPSVIQMANSVFGAGEAEKTKRAQFTETVLQELRPLIGRLDTGMTAMDLNGALERVRLSLKMRNNPMAAYANEVTTALNGLVRGANLTGNYLMMGTYGAGTGYDLAKTQALMSLGVGYEGRGLSAGNDPQGSLRDTGTDNSALAKKIFGTEGRQWEAGLIKRYGIATLEPLSSKMADDIQAILPNSTVQKPIIDGVAHGRKAIDNIVETYATAVAKGLYGQDAEGVKQFSTNMVRMMYNMWGMNKPGGSMQKLFATATQLAQSGGYTFKGSISVEEQQKALAKMGTMFISGTRTIHGSVMLGQGSTPEGIASHVLTAAATSGHLMDFVSSKMSPAFKGSRPLSDKAILLSAGLVADHAKEVARVGLAKGGSMMGGLVDIAWLPVDIFTFVQGLKAGRLDTAEKIFHGIIIGTDVGVAVDGAISLTRALVPAAILKASRFATLFMGTSGAIMASLGAAFNLVNAMALVGLAIWQNFKTEQAFDRAGDRLDENLLKYTNNTTNDYLQEFPFAPIWSGKKGEEEAWQKHLDSMYKHDITPFDWAAVREANRKRFEAAA